MNWITAQKRCEAYGQSIALKTSFLNGAVRAKRMFRTRTNKPDSEYLYSTNPVCLALQIDNVYRPLAATYCSGLPRGWGRARPQRAQHRQAERKNSPFQLALLTDAIRRRSPPQNLMLWGAPSGKGRGAIAPRRGQRQHTQERNTVRLGENKKIYRIFAGQARSVAADEVRERKVRATESTVQVNSLIFERVWQRNRKEPPVARANFGG